MLLKEKNHCLRCLTLFYFINKIAYVVKKRIFALACSFMNRFLRYFKSWKFGPFCIKGQNLLTCIAHCFQTKSVLSFNKSSQNPNKSPLSYFLDRRITFLATIRADPSARIGSRDVILLLRKQLRGLLLGDWLLLLELRTDFVWKHWAMQLSKFWPMVTYQIQRNTSTFH